MNYYLIVITFIVIFFLLLKMEFKIGNACVLMDYEIMNKFREFYNSKRSKLTQIIQIPYFRGFKNCFTEKI